MIARNRFASLRLTQVLVGLACLGATARADWSESFEGPETSWREGGGDVRYRIEGHQRVAEGAHGGRWCERLRLVGNNGSVVYLRHEVPPARIIAELGVGVWVKSDRAGLQVLVRAVLPRSQDPKSGAAITTLLPGSGYTQSGSWQQLRVENLSQLIERQLRVLRTQFGPTVDAREAYIDQVVLNVYGGPGTTAVWIDDLELSGAVGGAVVRGPAEGAGSPKAFSTSLERPPASPPGSAAPVAPASALPEVSLRGSILLVDGKPFFPRIIQYRGEPLTKLQALGFNTVLVSQEPPAELLAEAARLKMWIVTPPPGLFTAAPDARPAAMGSQYDAVLAWDMGSGLTARELDAVRREAKYLRAADTRNRPLLCGADTQLRDYSRLVDMMWAERPVLGTSLEYSAFARWQRDRQLLARPGTPVWMNVQTQPLPRLNEQCNLLAGRAVAVDRLQDEQVRQLVYAALAAGARGLCFESQTPLNAEDAATQRRAELLELINLELDLIEPWAAAGNFVTTAVSNDPQGQAAVVQTERGRLLLPLRTTPQSQLAIGPTTMPSISYVVPGVPESNDAWELTPAGLQPLSHKRVAGGLRVNLAPGDAGSLVVLTQDTLVINYLMRRTAQVASRAATLQRDLAQRQLQFVEALDQRLTSLGRGLPTVQLTLTAARADMREAEGTSGPQGSTRAYAAARHAVENLQMVERAYWEKGAALTPNWLASPLATSVATMPDQWLLAVDLAGRRIGANQLAGGDFEDLPRMLGAGWRHSQHPLPGIITDAALLSDVPHSGKLSLRLKASVAPKVAFTPPSLLESPPISVTTPAIPVRAGQIAWIHGWVRMSGAPACSVDGLMIVDSLGGETLAERIGATRGWEEIERAKKGLKPKPKPTPKPPAPGKSKPTAAETEQEKKQHQEKELKEDWKEFALYRAAPQSMSLTVTFALTGLGEAWLDDVTIQLIDRDGRAMAQMPAGGVQPGFAAPR